eukprot:COSAG04_NODE_360_length_15920_cov_50.432815_16_plen_85_part_00
MRLNGVFAFLASRRLAVPLPQTPDIDACRCRSRSPKRTVRKKPPAKGRPPACTQSPARPSATSFLRPAFLSVARSHLPLLRIFC